ncbi:MAG TPA: SDR family NAD(P)-dependent oxidoreductase [Burkholderiales bacterium]|nr:SDR family NAD(P)-dependent oxidoreductase [Burkholderiales bacterium]
MSDTIVWISGATGGIGASLKRHVPYPGARIINLDVREAEGCENVKFDLLDPASWERVAAHFAAELGAFKGKRAIFLQQAFVASGMGLIGKVDRAGYSNSLTANFVAPVMLAEAFLRASRPGYELGLMLMSSGAATGTLGQSAYGAAKAGLETWVKIARAEFKRRPDTWIVAVRPGLVRTDTARKSLDWDKELYPRVDALREAFGTVGVDPDLGGKRIWKVLPPQPDRALISFDGSIDDKATI